MSDAFEEYRQSVVNLTQKIELMTVLNEAFSIPCESPNHCSNLYQDHEGKGAFYTMTSHSCLGPVGELFPVCEKYERKLIKLIKQWLGMK